MTNGIDTDMQPMQAPGHHPAADGAATEAEGQELPLRHHAVLPVRNPGDLNLTWAR